MKKKILIGVVIISLIILFRVLGFDQYLNTTYLIEQREQLLALVGDNFILTAFIFISIYIVATAFSIPGAAVLSLAGGLLFGLGFGLIFVNIGASLGATINFIFARYIIGDSIQKKYGDKFEKFNSDIEKNGKNYLLTLRLIPLFPFFLVNVLAGVSSVKMRTFVWTTIIGIIPGSIFYVYAGTTLKNADALTDFISWKTTLPLVILGLLVFLPVIINKFRKSSDEL
jgi:uncharacterized membrane protein YdjX (TVP38/TMEM64 family)